MATSAPIEAAADIIERFSKSVLDYALVFAAVGTITMALIELFKSVFDLRLKYNRNQLEKWMPDNLYPGARMELLSLATGAMQTPTLGRGFKEFLIGEIEASDVIFDQPAEKMLGQLQAAVNVAMDFPQIYTSVYRFLTNLPVGQEPQGDPKVWLDFARDVASGQKVDENRARAATQARARLGNFVARKLDAFQNRTQYLWAELNQRAAFVVGTIFLIFVFWPKEGFPSADFLRAMILALFGGLVAPFAKDVVSALSGLTVKRK